MSLCWRCSSSSPRCIANVLSFGHRVIGAVLSAVLFAAAFVFWTYYPHHLPLPTALTPPKAAVTTAPAPAAPAAPTAAAQSGDGYHAARRPGFSAGRSACKSAPRALGLRPTVLLMFSHVWVGS